MCHVLGDVVAGGVMDGKAMVDAREERAVATSLKLVLELGEPYQDKRQERATVPLVVE